MGQIFIRFVNYSLVAGWLIIAVLIARALLKKAPRWITCLLWALVAIRLVFPFSIESAFSLIPSAEPFPEDFSYTQTPRIESGFEAVDLSVNPMLSQSLGVTGGGNSVNPSQVWSFVLSLVWVAGVTVMVLYAVISTIVLKYKLCTSTSYGEGIRQTEAIKTPFVLGIFKPTIYIPYNLSDDELKYVIAHEKAHIKRMDILWKPLGFLILSLYWFNPLVWVAYILLCKDIEAACDEKVVKDMEVNERREYSTALLNCSISPRRITACPVAFGENNVKSRIKGVMNYKKPAFWIVVTALAACMVVAVCFLTNPKKTDKESMEVVESIGDVAEPEDITVLEQEPVQTVEEESKEYLPTYSIPLEVAEKKWEDFGFESEPLLLNEEASVHGYGLRNEWNIIAPFWQFVAPEGTPVLAVTSGEITEGFDVAEGRYVDLHPSNNSDMIIRYCHLDEQSFSEPAKVEAGTQIGTVGATGRATGPFLKVEVFDDLKQAAVSLEPGALTKVQRHFLCEDMMTWIVCDYSLTLKDEQHPIDIIVASSDGRVLWNKQLGIPHMGRNSFYYYTEDDKDYIIEYNPSESTGEIEYWFRMYSLDKDGGECIKCEFYANSQDEIEEFNKNIAPYLEKAELLISTIDGEIKTEL